MRLHVPHNRPKMLQTSLIVCCPHGSLDALFHIVISPKWRRTSKLLSRCLATSIPLIRTHRNSQPQIKEYKNNKSTRPYLAAHSYTRDNDGIIVPSLSPISAPIGQSANYWLASGVLCFRLGMIAVAIVQLMVYEQVIFPLKLTVYGQFRQILYILL
jgi:hypothetical protein